MGLKSSFTKKDPPTGAMCTDKYINTAYDEVKIVADNIDSVIAVADCVPHLLVYLGAHTEPPTTRLDGSPLQDGDYYFDTVMNALVYYNLSEDSWLVIDPAELLQARDEAVAARDEAVTAAGEAEASANVATTKASEASDSADAASVSEDNAALSESNALNSANNASTKADEASTSASNAATSENNAATSASEASTSETNAKNSEDAAALSESNASTYANNALNEADRATAAADSAEEDADRAEAAASELEWKKFARNEADDNAERAINKRRFNSGFVHYGNHQDGGGYEPVNVGMMCRTNNAAWANKLAMGSETGTNHVDISASDFPVTCIAGVISEIYGIGESTYSEVHFPEAPAGYDVADSTGDCRGSGKAVLNLLTDIDPKYGDVAGTRNEAVARAFEGNVKNGDFRNLGVDWTQLTGGWSFSEGKAHTNTATYQPMYQNVGFVNGQTYKVSVYVEVTSGGLDCKTTASGVGVIDVLFENVTETGHYEVTFTATSNNPEIAFYRNSTNGSFNGSIDAVRVTPVTEEVIIAPEDMFGMEYWKEIVSETNQHVYKYGKIQSKVTEINGIPTVRSNRPASYYARWDGDENSVGDSVAFWDATDEEKIALLQDEDNKLFLGRDAYGVDIVYQWRMRQRTIRGAGNGKWQSIDPAVNDTTFNSFLCYTTAVRTLMQGNNDTVGTDQGTDVFVQTLGSTWIADGEVGVFKGRDSAAGNFALNGECYFHVWGSVPRLNQGAYHPLNEMGARTCNGNISQAVGHYWWHISALAPRTLAECFRVIDAAVDTTTRGAAQQSGYIGTTLFARDDGKFYDAIYPSGQGGVIDNRLPAKDMSSAEEAAKVEAKVGDGTYRGVENLRYTFAADSVNVSEVPSTTFHAIDIHAGSLKLVGRFPKKATCYVDGTIQWETTDFQAVSYADGGAVVLRTTQGLPRWDRGQYVVEFETDIQAEGNKDNGFTCKDVIGDPANIIQVAELAQGWFGYWIPVLPSEGVGFPLTRKAIDVSSGVNLYCIYTYDLGVTWSTGNRAFDSVKNTQTTILNGQPLAVQITPYQAAPEVTKPSTNKPVLNGKAGLGNVWASKRSNVLNDGVLLGESLIGKVFTDGDDNPDTHTYNLTKCHLDGSANFLATSSAQGSTEHTPIDLGSTTSPAVKALSYQTSDNQLLSLNYAYNELVWKTGSTITVTMSTLMNANPVGTEVRFLGGVFSGVYNVVNAGRGSSFQTYYDAGTLFKNGDGDLVNENGTVYLRELPRVGGNWGDDSTIRITDGQGTFVNLNGDTCLYGTNELTKPYGYSLNLARISEQTEGVDL